MNPRRDFFRKLFVGAAALPVVVKAVISAKEKPKVTVRSLARWTVNPEWESANCIFADEIQWTNSDEIMWEYRWEGGRLIQSSNGKDCLIYRVDSNPLRFTA